MADTKFEDLAALLGASMAAGDYLLVLDSTGNVSKKILVSEVVPTQAIAEAGTDNVRFMTPLRSLQLIDSEFEHVTKTASASASVDFDDPSDIDVSKYDILRFDFVHVQPSTDDAALQLVLTTGGVEDTGASDYQYATIGRKIGGTITEDSNAAAAAFLTASSSGEGVGAAAGEHGVNGHLTIYGMDKNRRTHWVGQFTYVAGSGGIVHVSVGGFFNQTSNPNDGVHFKFDAGNVASGNITATGIRKSA